jgi:hypothetical protein
MKLLKQKTTNKKSRCIGVNRGMGLASKHQKYTDDTGKIKNPYINGEGEPLPWEKEEYRRLKKTQPDKASPEYMKSRLKEWVRARNPTPTP